MGVLMGKKSREKRLRREDSTAVHPTRRAPDRKISEPGLEDIPEFAADDVSYTVTRVPKLHKYFSVDRLISVLRQPSLRFTQPEHLNDPYECHLTLDRHLLAADYRSFRKRGSPMISEIELDRACEMAESTIVIDALLEYRRWRNNVGILSLTEDPLQLLMWAHYAQDHAGVCVELDVSLLMPKTGAVQPGQCSILRPVRYQQEKIAGLPRHETMIEVLTTKSEHWSYEREWRLVRSLDLTRKIDDKVYVVDFPLDAIKTVYLGAKFPAPSLEAVVDLARQQGGDHINFVKVDIAPHRFVLRTTDAYDYGWKLLHREHHFGEAAHEALVCLPMDGDS
ncbi:hypothetical protein C6P96_16330 [Burkholderia multivorans]|uniref:DUF2971 domain-containing protein n=2 Tax=Burkholderia multivorans TaxID=87883 RepID=UPI000D00B238|nr:DUF2971 domain-containing protein [Burkholderia multivorans]PRE60240.1 hypothetical protein C6P95_26390 [Burkholderia multivorans]PRF11221.1 hypothetical protein C6P96_16330 [Burkholderia multivorans]